MPTELAVLGAGNMAEAIVRGILAADTIPAARIVACDVSARRREFFERTLGVRAVESPAEASAGASRILLSVKPHQVREVLAAAAGSIGPDCLVVSICAGISAARIERLLHPIPRPRVVRTMPNTPLLVGEGAVAIAAGTHAGAQDMAAARALFAGSALVVEVPESQLDAVTALSGSGPAYFFLLVEHMIRAGVEMGLAPETARDLAVRTAAGAARMLEKTGESPQELRRKVTTPNGTTHAAVSTFERLGLPAAVGEALRAAAERSRQLGEELSA
mgnify:CR=1 FL=1